MKGIVLDVYDDGCGLLEFELPSDATDDEIAYIESFVPRLEAGVLELFDPDTGDVVFNCRPNLVQAPASSFVRVVRGHFGLVAQVGGSEGNPQV
jgi:hypothetical protein